jgi:hypothetical protein
LSSENCISIPPAVELVVLLIVKIKVLNPVVTVEVPMNDDADDDAKELLLSI